MVGKWNTKKQINNINLISLAIKLKPKHMEELESEVFMKPGSAWINSIHAKPAN